MVIAVHLSAIRSRTRRDGHCASRTEAAEPFLDILLCNREDGAGKPECNRPNGRYGLAGRGERLSFTRLRFQLAARDESSRYRKRRARTRADLEVEAIAGRRSDFLRAR